MGALVLSPLVEVPWAMGPLASLYREVWPGWYGPGGRGDAAADLRARARAEGLPWGICAFIEGRPVGAAALAESSHGAERGEGPWLVGLATAPGARGMGVASALVAACERQAGAPLWATTTGARSLLMRRGWRVLRELGGGEAVLVRDG